TNAVSTMDLTRETHGGHMGATSPAVAKSRTMHRREDSEKRRTEDTRSSVEKILARLGPTHKRPMGLQGNTGRTKIGILRPSDRLKQQRDEGVLKDNRRERTNRERDH